MLGLLGLGSFTSTVKDLHNLDTTDLIFDFKIKKQNFLRINNLGHMAQNLNFNFEF